MLLVCAFGCRDSSSELSATPTPDFEQFQKSVYPMLLRNCAFSACHGDERRFFQVYGPGRARLDPKAMPSDAATMLEVERSYDRASSMLVAGSGARDSLLLRKPLEMSEGGQGHKGVDAAGRNVFASKLDPDYLLLEQWAMSSGAAPPASAGGKP